MILVDSNVIIDVVARDPIWAEWSRRQLNAATTDEIAINEIVYAEISAGYPTHRDVELFLSKSGLELIHTPRRALFLAGKAFHRYRRSGGTRVGVLPDFFIGAHAIVSDAKLLTRDPRLYRTYFPGISLITPDLN